MNNKPVGYFRKNYDGDWVEAEAGYEDDAIPLYTHPAKTLTDEEIIEEWSLTSYDPKTFIWSDEVNADLIIHFARAILRKAQE